MQRSRRIALTMLALSMLAVSLAFNSGAAHAQTRAVAAPAHTAIAADSGYTYVFSAGWWGGGICISHDKLQALAGWSAITNLLSAANIARLGSRIANEAVAGIFAFLWYTQVFVDRGNGVCYGWPYWIPSVPAFWAQ